MNARGMLGVVAAGAAWVGVACGPAEPMGEEVPLVQQTQTQDIPGTESGGGEGRPPACGREPGYTYVLRDPSQCAAAFFVCPAGQTAFFNDCGCGCRPR